MNAWNGIQYVLLDADDTVVTTSGDDHPSYEKGRKQLAHVIDMSKRGEFPPVGLCTGREASYVLGMLRWAGLPNCWSIVESGLILYNPATQERLYHPRFTRELQESFQEIRRVRVPRLLSEFPFLELYIGKEWNIALERRSEAPPMEECLQAVQEALTGVRGIAINASSIAVDLSPEGIDKGAGVLFLAEVTGVHASAMLLVDDSLGGKPAADQVGFLACPANAAPRFQNLVRDRGPRGVVSELELVEGAVDGMSRLTGIAVLA